MTDVVRHSLMYVWPPFDFEKCTLGSRRKQVKEALLSRIEEMLHIFMNANVYNKCARAYVIALFSATCFPELLSYELPKSRCIRFGLHASTSRGGIPRKLHNFSQGMQLMNG